MKKKCKSCGDEFEPRNIGNTTIRTNKCLKCIALANLKKIKQDKTKKQKEGLMTTQDWLKIAQTHFNHFIRLRDKGRLCISCQKPLGPRYDCGHFYSSGGHSNLRFNEDNCHGQHSRPCNLDLSGDLHNYRIGLIGRIGLDRLQSLEQQAKATKRWTIPELKELISLYKKKINELKLM